MVKLLCFSSIFPELPQQVLTFHSLPITSGSSGLSGPPSKNSSSPRFRRSVAAAAAKGRRKKLESIAFSEHQAFTTNTDNNEGLASPSDALSERLICLLRRAEEPQSIQFLSAGRIYQYQCLVDRLSLKATSERSSLRRRKKAGMLSCSLALQCAAAQLSSRW